MNNTARNEIRVYSISKSDISETDRYFKIVVSVLVWTKEEHIEQHGVINVSGVLHDYPNERKWVGKTTLTNQTRDGSYLDYLFACTFQIPKENIENPIIISWLESKVLNIYDSHSGNPGTFYEPSYDINSGHLKWCKICH